MKSTFPTHSELSVCLLRGNAITGSWTGRPSRCTRTRAAPSTTRWSSRLTRCPLMWPPELMGSPLFLLPLQEITLSEVLRVRGPAELSVAPSPGNSAHTLEVVTAAVVYCVLAGESGPAWESAIHQALMPFQSSRGGGEENQGELGNPSRDWILFFTA